MAHAVASIKDLARDFAVKADAVKSVQSAIPVPVKGSAGVLSHFMVIADESDLSDIRDELGTEFRGIEIRYHGSQEAGPFA